MKDSYTKKEVAEITGLPYRNIQFYAEQGVVVPEIEQAGGRGKFRRYSNRNLMAFIIAGELAQYGVTVGEIRKIILSFLPFWEMKVPGDTSGTFEKVPDGKVLSLFSEITFTLRIGRTKDNTQVVQWRVGSDDLQRASFTFSIVTSPDGGKILHLQNNQKDEGPYTITMDENQKKIENYDLEALLKDGLVSFVYISVDELITEALKRMP